MRRLTIGLAVVALVLTGCDKNPMESTGDRLTRAEALAIAEGVSGAGSSATSGLNTSPSANGITTASEPHTIRLQHEGDHRCPTSGRIQVAIDASLTFDLQAGSFAADVDGSLDPDACAFVKDGVTLTITGDPDLNFEAHASAENHRPVGSWSSEASGAVNWTASDGRSGRCVVDISDVTDFVAKTRTVEGEVCGHEVRSVLTWS
jgi:hypothetical protein